MEGTSVSRINNVVQLNKDWFRTQREVGAAAVVPKRQKLAPRYYSLSEMAQRFQCGYDLLYKAIRSRELEAEVVGRSYRVSEEAMEKYLTLCRKKKSV
jgi:excisionase family DNA binding protein